MWIKQNTIKTIDSYIPDTNETLLSTCANESLIKIRQKRNMKKDQENDFLMPKKDNFRKYNKCKQFGWYKFIN